MISRLPILCLFLLSSISGCATMDGSSKRPVFYPNSHLQRVGQMQAEQDTTFCMGLADEYVQEPNKYQEMAKGAAIGGVTGAATGAVGGVIMGNTGRGTAAGAAVGAILGLLNEMRKQGEGDPTYQAFVSQCLANKGYQVYAWK
ncbi:MAG: glycine zipper family protein [Bdellovibrionota bacterium]|nr:MAG: glycine zipper family protein [Bdellovibrionota bacterium]